MARVKCVEVGRRRRLIGKRTHKRRGCPKGRRADGKSREQSWFCGWNFTASPAPLSLPSTPFLKLDYFYIVGSSPPNLGDKGLAQVQFSSVQSLRCVRLFVTPWIAARQAFLSITNTRSSLKLMSIESVMPSRYLILCHPLLLLSPNPPNIRVFSNESTLRVRWPKYWSFSFSIIPSKEIPGLISFRMDCLDLIAVQGTLKSLLQHHSSKPSILRCSAFFIVQLSHTYMTTGKTIALTRRTFVAK